MPQRNKLNELAKREGRSVKEILIELYRVYGKQKLVAEKLRIAPSTLSQNIARLGGHEHTIVVFPEQEESS
jgi:DNA-binding MarR family transcriptional regulator